MPGAGLGAGYLACWGHDFCQLEGTCSFAPSSAVSFIKASKRRTVAESSPATKSSLDWQHPLGFGLLCVKGASENISTNGFGTCNCLGMSSGGRETFKSSRKASALGLQQKVILTVNQ